MILEEVIQRVQSLYSRGVQSRDSRLTARHIYSAISSARSILLSQMDTKNQKASQWAYQILPCVKLIEVSVHQCPCVPPSGCLILRSEHKLPSPVAGLDSSLIQSVSSLDGNITFDLTRFDTNKYNKGNKFTSKKPGYFPHSSYIYVTISRMLDSISVVGLFDDFLAARQFPSACGVCSDCECEDIMNVDFPIDGRLVKALIQLANDELIILMKQMQSDDTDNAEDNTDTNKGAMIHQPNEQEQ